MTTDKKVKIIKSGKERIAQLREAGRLVPAKHSETPEVKRGKPFKIGVATVKHLNMLNKYTKISLDAARNAAMDKAA